jgi:hypothetical protein
LALAIEDLTPMVDASMTVGFKAMLQIFCAFGLDELSLCGETE